MTPSYENPQREIDAPIYRFDPVDLVQMRLLRQLPPQKRVRVMLDAREVVVGLIRGRLRREYPELSTREINLKLLEELAREVRPFVRDQPVPGRSADS